MDNSRKTFVNFMNGVLKQTYCVTDPEEIDQMYEMYRSKMQKTGEKLTNKEKILFLTTGVVCRDDEPEILSDEAKKEAYGAYSFLYKYGLSLDDVVLRIGFCNDVYVASLPSQKAYAKTETGKIL